METGESLEACQPLPQPGVHSSQQQETTISNKVDVEDQHPRLSSYLQMHTSAHTAPLTLTGTYELNPHPHIHTTHIHHTHILKEKPFW